MHNLINKRISVKGSHQIDGFLRLSTNLFDKKELYLEVSVSQPNAENRSTVIVILSNSNMLDHNDEEVVNACVDIILSQYEVKEL